MKNQKPQKFFKCVIERVERRSLKVAVRADSYADAIEQIQAQLKAGEYDEDFGLPYDVATEVKPAITNWYDFESLTAADWGEVQGDSMDRRWGYSLADLKKEIAAFRKAMDKADVHATSMICARLEDCNYHTVCGRLSEGDLEAATAAAEEIYAA